MLPLENVMVLHKRLRSLFFQYDFHLSVRRYSKYRSSIQFLHPEDIRFARLCESAREEAQNGQTLPPAITTANAERESPTRRSPNMIEPSTSLVTMTEIAIEMSEIAVEMIEIAVGMQVDR